MEINTVPIHHLLAILDAAAYRGLDRQLILDKFGISKELLNHPKSRISATDYQQISLFIREELNDEYGGFMEKPGKIGTFAMMCRACISCPTLESHFKRSSEFSNMVTNDLELELIIGDEISQFIFHPKKGMRDPQGFFAIVLMGLTHRLASWMINKPLQLHSVYVPHERPVHAPEYDFLFKAPIKFNQQQFSLNFSNTCLSFPIKQTVETLESILNAPGVHLMAMSDNADSITAKVKQAIRESDFCNFPEFDDISKGLHMTSATLRRRLRAEGSSYQQLKDDIRRDTAIYHLSRGIMPIDHVAEQVGFSEPTSFFRAFKRWTGVTPRDYVKKDTH